jgi:hypothetical protein
MRWDLLRTQTGAMHLAKGEGKRAIAYCRWAYCNLHVRGL